MQLARGKLLCKNVIAAIFDVGNGLCKGCQVFDFT
jgi:hypothetical protein